MEPEEIGSRTEDDLSMEPRESLIERATVARRDHTEAALLHNLEICFVQNAQKLYQQSKNSRHYKDRLRYLTRLLELYHAIQYLIQPNEDGTEPDETEDG
jgi:hypothetical protein